MRYYIELKHTRTFLRWGLFVFSYKKLTFFFFNKILVSKLSVLLQLIFRDTSTGENNSTRRLAVEGSADMAKS